MSTVIVADEDEGYGSPEFSWRAVFAGALVAIAVTFFLLLLGSGVGLSLISIPTAGANTAKNALTGGAIYFFVAQAFGLAVGGHLAGRLMGPVLESESEENFHATTHGLVVWALAVVATITMVAISGLVAGSSALNAAALFGASNPSGQTQASAGPEANNYWVDMLFRPVPADANPATTVTPAAATGTQPDTEARAEAGRIVTFGLAHGERLSQDDYNELVRLVSQSTGANPGEAGRRVNNVQTRMHQQELNTAEAARRLVKDISLWLAASLIFGGLVAAGAAVSGRWEDDRARA